VRIVTGQEEEPVRARYFRWLYSQVFPDQDPGESYTDVCELMHEIPFNDSIPNDSNRTADGEELRDEFISLDEGIDLDAFTEMAGLGKASLFEILIGLAKRAESVTEALKPDQWFRTFLGNLGLLKYPDDRYLPRHILRVNRILRTFNGRTFDPDGNGGIFPLAKPPVDQRKIELWFQMAAYINENQMY
jgi:hypothetical protein